MSPDYTLWANRDVIKKENMLFKLQKSASFYMDAEELSTFNMWLSRFEDTYNPIFLERARNVIMNSSNRMTKILCNCVL